MKLKSNTQVIYLENKANHMVTTLWTKLAQDQDLQLNNNTESKYNRKLKTSCIYLDLQPVYSYRPLSSPFPFDENKSFQHFFKLSP